MSLKPMILGYFIWPHDGSEGFASTSLEELLNSYENKVKFPFINEARLQRLRDRPDIRRNTINGIGISDEANTSGCSPTGRFLYQMVASGMYEKLEIPLNRLIITTNRRTIIEIIKFGQSRNFENLTLKTKLRNQKYGKKLKMGYVNQAQMDYFRGTKTSNGLFGLKFGSYITTDENKTDKKDATLFSIHCLHIDDVCFIYEAEIDAIQYTKNDYSGNIAISIVEIKTYNDRNGIISAFKEYTECSKMNDSLRSQRESSLSNLEEIFLDQKCVLPFRQGELGNVHKFIYGFHDAKNHSALSCIRAMEFDYYPGTLLTHDAGHLLDFVQLLTVSGILSNSYGITWENWNSWKLTKTENSMKLEKDGEILGSLSPWEIV